MKTLQIISFAYRLLRRRLGRNILVFGGVFIGTFLLVLFLSFAEGVKLSILLPIEKELSSEALVVMAEPKTSSGFDPLVFFRARSEGYISPEIFRQIEKLPEVKKVYPETRIPFPVATNAEIIFGVGFAFDSTLSGYPSELLQEYLPEWQTFTGSEDFIPVVLSPLLVEIYNSTIGEIVPGASKKTLKNFLGQEMEFTFGKINYLDFFQSFPEGVSPEVKKGKIVGFAPFLSPFTFGIPEKIAREMWMKYEKISAEELLPKSTVVKVWNQEDVPLLKQKFQEMHLLTRDLSANLDTVRNLLFGLETIILITAGLILALAFLFCGSVLSLSILEHQKSIGILQTLGGSPSDIRNIFFSQGILILGGGIFSGCIFAFVLGNVLNSIILPSLPEFSIAPSSIFYFNWMFFLKIFAIIFFGAITVAYVPARNAGRRSPLETILH
ncbi:FtsX-like permease family protein [Candidatus Peregrinibacteria bacterium]|nr:FtsX-like permease family protein [Candidatus Peregrinibacteria bacterium]